MIDDKGMIQGEVHADSSVDWSKALILKSWPNKSPWNEKTKDDHASESSRTFKTPWQPSSGNALEPY